MSGDTLTMSAQDLNFPMQRDSRPISLDIVRKGR